MDGCVFSLKNFGGLGPNIAGGKKQGQEKDKPERETFHPSFFSSDVTLKCWISSAIKSTFLLILSSKSGSSFRESMLLTSFKPVLILPMRRLKDQIKWFKAFSS